MPTRRQSFFSRLAGILLVIPFVFPQTLVAQDPLPVADGSKLESVSFTRDILPIFRKKCLACHNQSDKEGELVLESVATIRKGGDSGPAIVAGKPDASLLFVLARHADEPIMPPEDNDVGASNLTPDELARLRRWIELGAEEGKSTAEAKMDWRAIPEGPHPIFALAVAPNGRYLVASRGNRLTLYHLGARQRWTDLSDPALVRSGLYEKRPPAHLDYVQSVAFHPTRPIVASGGYRTIKIWQRVEPSGQIVAPAGGAPVLQADAARDTDVAVVLRGDGTVSWYRSGSTKSFAMWKADQALLALLSVSPDGTQIAVATKENRVEVRGTDGKIQGSRAFSEPVHAIALVDSKTLVVGLGDRVVVLANQPDHNKEGNQQSTSADKEGKKQSSQSVPPWPVVGELREGKGPVSALEPMAGQPTSVVAGGEDGMVRVWDVRAKKVMRRVSTGKPIRALAVSGDGKRMVVVHGDGLAGLWDLPTGKRIADWKVDPDWELELDRVRWKAELAKLRVNGANQDVKAAENRLKGEETNAKKASEEQKQASEALAKQKEALEKARKAFEQAKQKQQAAQEALQQEEKKLESVLAELKKVTEEIERLKKEKADTAEVQKRRSDLAKQEQAVRAKIGQLKSEHQKATAAMKPVRQELDKAEAAVKTAQTNLQSAERTAQRAAELVQRAKQELAEAKKVSEQLEAARRQADEARQAKEKTASPTMTFVAASFSRGGRFALTVSGDGRLYLWDAVTGAGLERAETGSAKVASLTCFGSQAILVGTSDGELKRWPLVPQWKLVQTIGDVTDAGSLADRVTALAFSPDGRLLASGSGDPSRSGQLRIWEWESGKLEKEIPEPHSDMVLDVAFSHDGQFIASSGADRFVKVFDVHSGKHVRSYEGHTSHVLGVAFSADDRLLASASADQSAKMWDARTGEQKRTIGGFKKEVTDIGFQGLTTNVLLAAGDPAVQLRRSDNGGVLRTFPGVSDYVYVVSSDRRGKRIAAAGHQSVVWVWSDDGKAWASFPYAGETLDSKK